MGGVLAYTVEAGLVFVVLTAVYRHVYYGISYNRWERGYLLAATAASCLLPVLKMEYLMAPVPKPADSIVGIVERGEGYDVVTISRRCMADGAIDTVLRSSFFDKIVAILFAVYMLGVLVKMFSFVRGLTKTLRLAGRSRKLRSVDGVDVYETDVNTVAFSFFGKIFLGAKSRGLSDGERDVIIRHELEHVKGLHSIDTLVFGLYSVFQWFNPAVRYAARYSRIVCENIADSQAVGGGSLTEYSRLVLRLGIQNSDNVAAARPRRKSPLVERIAQLFNTDGERIRRIRFYAALPVLAVAVAAYIMFFGMLTPTDPRYEMPVKGGYEVVAGFVKSQRVCDADGKVCIVSHRLVNLRLCPGAVIVPPTEAVDVRTDGDGCSFRLGGCTVTLQVPSPKYNGLPASLIVADQRGNAIDPQTIFKM